MVDIFLGCQSPVPIPAADVPVLMTLCRMLHLHVAPAPGGAALLVDSPLVGRRVSISAASGSAAGLPERDPADRLRRWLTAAGARVCGTPADGGQLRVDANIAFISLPAPTSLRLTYPRPGRSHHRRLASCVTGALRRATGGPVSVQPSWRWPLGPDAAGTGARVQVRGPADQLWALVPALYCGLARYLAAADAAPLHQALAVAMTTGVRPPHPADVPHPTGPAAGAQLSLLRPIRALLVPPTGKEPTYRFGQQPPPVPPGDPPVPCFHPIEAGGPVLSGPADLPLVAGGQPAVADAVASELTDTADPALLELVAALLAAAFGPAAPPAGTPTPPATAAVAADCLPPRQHWIRSSPGDPGP